MAKIQTNIGKHKGFTLVELIIVIIIMGILAVSAFSRFSGNSGYAEYTYQAKLISALRNMQNRAMQDNRDGFCFKINLNTATPAFGPPILNYAPVGSITDTCNNSISFSNPEYLTTSALEMTEQGVSITTIPIFAYIDFDSLGRPTADSADCSASCKITLTGDDAASVCIESEGYVHAC